VKVKFVGTGSGKTSLNRHHSSLLISSNNHNLLIDCGDGISTALLKQKISFDEINSIIISHLHSDHFAGLPSLLTQMKLSGRINPLKIFAPESDLNFIETLIERFYLFKERMDFELTLLPYKSDSEIILADEFKLLTKFNSHLDKYKTAHPDKEFSSSSFIISDAQLKILYSADIGSVKDLINIDSNFDYAITEISHISFKEVLDLAGKFHPAKIILTHINNESESQVKSQIDSLQNKLKSQIILAFDGFEL
jgi:ribonuclease Z